MTSGTRSLLSESASNVVENLACRVAQRRGGRITPNDLLPYLPVSLGLVQSCLDDMVDGTSVVSEVQAGLLGYEFTAYKDSPADRGDLSVLSCVACDKDQAAPGGEVLCPACLALLRSELNTLAEKTGWPAQAVYEHEILYHAAQQTGPVPAETLAGVSPYTLRNMRRKLNKLTLAHFARQELDEAEGMMNYAFPPINYPKPLYGKNMAVIRAYPASVMEEVQVKVVKILLTLGLMVLAMLGLAFCGVPFPILVLLLFVAGPVTAFVIWRHRDRPGED